MNTKKIGKILVFGAVIIGKLTILDVCGFPGNASANLYLIKTV